MSEDQDYAKAFLDRVDTGERTNSESEMIFEDLFELENKSTAQDQFHYEINSVQNDNELINFGTLNSDNVCLTEFDILRLVDVRYSNYYQIPEDINSNANMNQHPSSSELIQIEGRNRTFIEKDIDNNAQNNVIFKFPSNFDISCTLYTISFLSV